MVSHIQRLTDAVRGRVTWQGEEDFEPSLAGLVWQERKPDRRPDVIVRAADEADVVAAVRWAGETGMTVTARSGGHSWAGTSIRDGGVVIDLENLDGIEIAPDRSSVTVGPAVRGGRLDRALREHDRFFPTGHCADVAMGGFLLGGGYGWWSQHYRQACLSVTRIRVVTAAGELIVADDTQNQDFFWAARGAGPGFFGIVVQFELAVHPRPRAIALSNRLFPRDTYPELVRWAWTAREALDDRVEFMILPLQAPDGAELVAVMAVSIGDDWGDAAARLRPVLDCPSADRAVESTPPVPVGMDDLYAAMDEMGPSGVRYAVDNAWIDGDVEDVLPVIGEAYAGLPSPRSYLLWFHWFPKPLPANAALSMQAPIWLSAYAIYDSEADDARCQGWVTQLMTRFQPHSPGTLIGDENFAHRFYRPLSDGSLERLEELRRRHDGAGRFPSFPRPAPAAGHGG